MLEFWKSKFNEIYNQFNRGIDFNIKTEYRNGSKHVKWYFALFWFGLKNKLWAIWNLCEWEMQIDTF